MNGQEFKARREAMQLSQAQLAHAIEATKGTVIEWENSKDEVPASVQQRLRLLELAHIAEMHINAGHPDPFRTAAERDLIGPSVRLLTEARDPTRRPGRPPTNTSLDFIRVDVPCPKCNHTDLLPLAALLDMDTTTCRYCTSVIDLRPLQPEFKERAEIHTRIKKLSGYVRGD